MHLFMHLSASLCIFYFSVRKCCFCFFKDSQGIHEFPSPDYKGRCPCGNLGFQVTEHPRSHAHSHGGGGQQLSCSPACPLCEVFAAGVRGRDSSAPVRDERRGRQGRSLQAGHGEQPVRQESTDNTTGLDNDVPQEVLRPSASPPCSPEWRGFPSL